VTISDRIEDANFLWQNNRKEGALLSVLIAVAAAASAKYPTLRDRERFEKYVQESLNVRFSVEFRGEMHPLEGVFYKFLRCELVHEGGLPQDIKFAEEEQENTMSVRAGGAPDYLLIVGTGWYFHLVDMALNKGTLPASMAGP
jgi:hypothetical protein